MTRRSVRGMTGMLVAGALVVARDDDGERELLTGLKAAEPQPTAEQLQPGLGVGYVYGRFNHLKEFETKKFEPGKPLPKLDYRMGDGAVLTTKERDQVGALITGFIRFEKPGTYGFDVTSNDGVRVEIGGKLLYEDPSVHSDDTSDRIDVKVDQPGWYPIKIVYYEKKGTATLVLRWMRGERRQGEARRGAGGGVRAPEVGAPWPGGPPGALAVAVLPVEGVEAVDPEVRAGLPRVDALDRHAAEPVLDDDRLKRSADDADREDLLRVDVEHLRPDRGPARPGRSTPATAGRARRGAAPPGASAPRPSRPLLSK